MASAVFMTSTGEPKIDTAAPLMLNLCKSRAILGKVPQSLESQRSKEEDHGDSVLAGLYATPV